MTAFHPVPPRKAVEFVEAAGIDHAERKISDHAAAGLLKSYALAVETRPVSGDPARVLGAAVPVALWKRIVNEQVESEVWAGGAVRLASSGLVGGAPAVAITGIGFNPADLQSLVDYYRGGTAKPKPSAAPPAPITEDAPPPRSARQKRRANHSLLESGAALLTIAETQEALGLGRMTCSPFLLHS